jgi:hypothetical protein
VQVSAKEYKPQEPCTPMLYCGLSWPNSKHGRWNFVNVYHVSLPSYLAAYEQHLLLVCGTMTQFHLRLAEGGGVSALVAVAICAP